MCAVHRPSKNKVTFFEAAREIIPLKQKFHEQNSPVSFYWQKQQRLFKFVVLESRDVTWLFKKERQKLL